MPAARKWAAGICGSSKSKRNRQLTAPCLPRRELKAKSGSKRQPESESSYTREKSRVDAMQAVLFRRLREHYQKRDRLRLIVDYRRKYLDSLVRGGDEEARQAEENYAKARAQSEKDYQETAAAVAGKKQLTLEEEAELNRPTPGHSRGLAVSFRPVDRTHHEGPRRSSGPAEAGCGSNRSSCITPTASRMSRKSLRMESRS